MRILIITNRYWPWEGGGSEVILRNMVSCLQKKSHEIFVLTTHFVKPTDQKYGKVFPLLELTSPYGTPPNSRISRRVYVCINNYHRTRKISEELLPDVVFCGHQSRLTLGPMYAIQDLEIPMLTIFNNEWVRQYKPTAFSLNPKNAVKVFLEKLVFRSLTFNRLKFIHTICVSQATKENICALGVPIENSMVLYPSIPLGPFLEARKSEIKSASTPSNVPVRVIFVGNFTIDKGLLVVLKAISHLIANSFCVSLTVVGDGPEREELFSFCRQRDISKHVRFLGWIPNEELPSIYAEHDIFVFPSIAHEAFPTTLIEAISAGVPAVSTLIGGHREFLKDGVNGLIFETGNYLQLADLIQRMANDHLLRKRLAENALKDVHSMFCIENFSNRVEAKLSEISKGEKFFIDSSR